MQTFAGGSFRPNPGAGTPAAEGTPTPGGGAAYLLTLEGHPGGTVYFSDRPDRVFGEAPTRDFLDGLGFSPANPPNAALVAQTDGGDEVVVLELLDPAYDADAGTVTYGAEVLAEYAGEGLAHVAERQAGAAPPEAFGRASLFIDDCPDGTIHCLSPTVGLDCNVAGTVSVGTCWSWVNLSCNLCSGDPLGYCTSNFPACREFPGCIPMFDDQYRRECLGLHG